MLLSLYPSISTSLSFPLSSGTHAYMISQAGARKLLQLCPKAVFHVDLDAWRHPSLVIRMFNPMLAYQTFEHSTLADMRDKRKGKLVQRIRSHESIKRLEEWAVDPVTLQPWTHVFDEPLLQLGTTHTPRPLLHAHTRYTHTYTHSRITHAHTRTPY